MVGCPECRGNGPDDGSSTGVVGARFHGVARADRTHSRRPRYTSCSSSCPPHVADGAASESGARRNGCGGKRCTATGAARAAGPTDRGVVVLHRNSRRRVVWTGRRVGRRRSTPSACARQGKQGAIGALRPACRIGTERVAGVRTSRTDFGSVWASIAPRRSRRPTRSASGAFGGPRNHGCNSRGSRHGSARAPALGCDTFAGGRCRPSCSPRTSRACEFGDHPAVHACIGRTASIRPRSGSSARLDCDAARVLGRCLVPSQVGRVNNRQSSIVVSRHSITCDIRGIREPPKCEAPAEQWPTGLAVRSAATVSRADAGARASGTTARGLDRATTAVQPAAGDKPGSGCRSFTETPKTDAARRLA